MLEQLELHPLEQNYRLKCARILLEICFFLSLLVIWIGICHDGMLLCMGYLHLPCPRQDLLNLLWNNDSPVDSDKCRSNILAAATIHGKFILQDLVAVFLTQICSNLLWSFNDLWLLRVTNLLVVSCKICKILLSFYLLYSLSYFIIVLF